MGAVETDVMLCHALSTALAACCVAASAPHATADEPIPSVADLPLEGAGVDPAFLERLNRALRDQVKRLGAATRGADDPHILRDAIPCGDDIACLTRVGARLGARNVLAGRVGRRGDQMQIALQLVEVGSGARRRHVEHTMPTDTTVDEAESQMRALTVEALAMETWVKSAPLVVTAPLAGVEVLVDGVLLGTTPLGAPLALQPGRREVEVRHPGLKSWRGFVDVAFEVTTTITLDIRDDALVWNRPSPGQAGMGALSSQGMSPRVVLGVGIASLGLAAGVGAAVSWGIATETYDDVYVRRDLALVDDHKMALTAYSFLLPTAIVATVVGGGLVGAASLE